jgi:processive 1,2-diacylglycerol beta-glucosyltransferase
VEEQAPLSVDRPRGVDLVFFDGGGAHRSGATSLRDALLALQPGLDVRVVDATTEIFRQAPQLRWLFGGGIALYNATLKSERMYYGDLEGAMRAGAWLSRVMRPGAMPAVRAYYREAAPRVVVSFVPMHNRLFFEALRAERPDARCMVVPVDFEELFPLYWFDPGADADYHCGTRRLAEDAIAAGVHASRVHTIPGMPTHPRYHEPRSIDRGATLAGLGLDPSLPTVLIFFGAQGSRTIVDVARYLDAGPTRVNLIAACGHHAEIRQRLSVWSSRSPKHVVGFTRDIPVLMRVSDVLVGKPGPVSIFEALASRLPMVLWDNPAFGVLFDYNLEWIERAGVGVRIRAAADVGDAVRRVLGGTGYREKTAEHMGNATAELAAVVVRALDDPARASARGQGLAARGMAAP